MVAVEKFGPVHFNEATGSSFISVALKTASGASTVTTYNSSGTVVTPIKVSSLGYVTFYAPAGSYQLQFRRSGQTAPSTAKITVAAPASVPGTTNGPISDSDVPSTITRDSELASALATVATALSSKQDASTAATDAELAAAAAAINTAIALKQDAATAATDAELAAAVSTINTALAAKQDASTAATVAALTAGLAAKQDAATAATDAELTAAVATINAALATKQNATGLTPTISPTKGAMVISFDDGYSEYMTLATEAENRGGRLTFFINTSIIGTAGHLTAANILDLYNRGHEIGAHSVTHPDMTLQTAAQRTAEWDDSKAALEAIIGAGNVKTWTYPGAKRNATLDQEAYLRYESTSSVTSGQNFPALSKIGVPQFLSFRLDWGATATTRRLATMYAKQCARQPVLAHVYSHLPTNTPGGFTPTFAEVYALMDLCVTLGVPMVTQSQGMGGERLVNNGGFEDSATLLDPWLATPGAGTSAEIITDTPDVGLTGTRSLHCNSTSDTGAISVSQLLAEVTPGTSITVSGRMRMNRVSGTGGAYFKIRGVDYLSANVTNTSSTVYTTNAWGRTTMVYTVPAGCRYVWLDLQLLNATGDAYFDHIHVGETGLGSFG